MKLSHSLRMICETLSSFSYPPAEFLNERKLHKFGKIGRKYVSKSYSDAECLLECRTIDRILFCVWFSKKSIILKQSPIVPLVRIA